MRDADQYRNSGNLRTRGDLHARYANRDWFDWVAGNLELSPSSDVIDIGCGAGWFWSSTADQMPRDVRLILIDISEGMVSEAVGALSENSVFGAVVGQTADAEALPFPDRSFDRVIAMHVLYHVSDCEKALNEVVRILRPGGLAVITTNGDDNLRQLFALGSEVFGGASVDPATQPGPLRIGRMVARGKRGEVAENVVGVRNRVAVLEAMHRNGIEAGRQ